MPRMHATFPNVYEYPEVSVPNVSTRTVAGGRTPAQAAHHRLPLHVTFGPRTVQYTVHSSLFHALLL
jgi:hypothetical protein